ncbi:MAG: response regulator transcription factor [Betaproteobacteria bacterium]|nr:response regulator transcription factor [Betaproteobacteria bacterium]
MSAGPAAPLRILIVDDEAPARRRMRELLGDCRAELPHVVAGEAGNGFEALELIADADPEVAPNLLADIHIPGMTGIELARHLQRLDAPPAVVFVTAHDQYEVAAFELNAVDYLLKPVRASRLAAALQRVVSGPRPAAAVFDKLDAQPRRHFSIAQRGRVRLVPVNDVLFMRAGQKYVALVTREHEYLVEDSLARLEEEFSSLFLHIHRSTLVARRHVRSFERMAAGHAEAEGEAGEGGQAGGSHAGGGEGGGAEGWGVRLEGWPELLPVSRRQWAQVKALIRT